MITAYPILADFVDILILTSCYVVSWWMPACKYDEAQLISPQL